MPKNMPNYVMTTHGKISGEDHEREDVHSTCHMINWLGINLVL